MENEKLLKMIVDLVAEMLELKQDLSVEKNNSNAWYRLYQELDRKQKNES